MTLEAGTRLGHYRIIALLGRGGMADVYRAEDERLGREVALKAVPPEFARDPERVERFEREVRAAARLTHPNIVTVYEFGQGAGQHFYTMALMPGGDLKARIRAHPEGMPPAEARAVAAAMARALDYAHRQGFVHRDVKPENILFGEDGAPQLTDFGIARAMSSGTRMTATGMSIGSPHYMSPEQARGKEVDGRSDLYSLGVVLYEMLTGRVPFDAADTFAVGLSHINDPVPELPRERAAWQPVVDRLLAKSPDDRFGSAGELAEILASDALPPAPATRMMPTGRDLSSPSRPQEPAPRLAAWATTRRGPLAALAGAALALAVVTIGYVALQDAGGPERRSPTGGGGSAAVQPAPAQPAPIPTLPSNPTNPFDVEDREEEPSNDGGADAEVRAAPPPPAPASPPPPPPAPEPVVGGGALLVVETTPPGAEVLVDGELVGETPLERADIRAGVREVTLRHPHYETVRMPDRNFEDGVALRVERVLTRGAGRLTVTATPRDAWVEVDGQRLAERTPVTLEDLPAGTVQLTVGAAEHRPLTVAVDIPRDGLARLEPTLDRFASGDRFRDGLAGGGEGPEMVVIPAGEFRMGCLNNGEECDDDEKPAHEVRIGGNFALGRYEVTVGEFRRFVESTGYRTEAERDADQGCRTREFSDPGRDGWDWTSGRSWWNLEYTVEERQPVVCVSWNDARAYVSWLSEETGEGYRLPSESEWEYAARAGTTTRYHFGNDADRLCEYGNVADRTELPNGNRWRTRAECSDGAVYPTTVGSYRANGFGLHDMHGNVWEWVQDCSHGSYEGAPGDGSAWTSGGSCGRRVLRGGSWSNAPRNLRAAYRNWLDGGYRNVNVGFRVARTLD